jgi:hypothetical protein
VLSASSMDRGSVYMPPTRGSAICHYCFQHRERCSTGSVDMADVVEAFDGHEQAFDSHNALR